MIKQNLLNFAAKMEFMKMSTPQKKALCVSWFIGTKLGIQTQWNFRRKYGRKQPVKSTIRLLHKKLWNPVVSHKEIELVDLKHPKLNLVVWHIAETLESSFAGAFAQLQISCPVVHYS